MRHDKRVPSLIDANVRQPDSTTTLLTGLINSLPDTSFKTRYLKNEFLSKYVSSETDPASVRRSRAIFKWLLTERNNASTNDRLLTLHEEFNILPRISWSRFRNRVQQIIARIIGDTVPFETLIGSFSGGSSTSRRRTESFPASKYTGKADITEEAFDYFVELFDIVPGWSSFWDQLDINCVPGNILFTVPKKTDIDRCACKEPDLNMFLQKGAGSFIRSSLRSVGINLNDQSRNQSLARVGSIDGSLATLDLSSASDSISRQLVFEFLPIHWFTFLDAIRSRVTLIDGEEHVCEMFSSMGNGFTFELESLLFYSIAKAVTYFGGHSGIISVYGDDIIIPSTAYDDLVFVLGVLGFEVNTSKSFASGPFRESCGGHFYNGHDVTPFYIKGPIVSLVDLIHVGNSLRKWASNDSFGILDPDVWPIWSAIQAKVPKIYHGGRDYSFKFQLVSPAMPNRRLSPVTRKRKLELGAYIHWLNATWVRENAQGDVVETSLLSSVGNRYRSRPASKEAVPVYIPEFLEELGL